MAVLSILGKGPGNSHRSGLLALLAWCLCSSRIIGSANATLLNAPNLLWTFPLEGNTSDGFALGGRGLRQGNAVVPWKGGDKLFVTADDGSLHILDTSQGKPSTSAVFVPTTVARTFTVCRSGVAVVEGVANSTAGTAPSPYLVYAVIDTPVASSSMTFNGSAVVGNNNSNLTSSRVIAVDMDGTIRWSVSMDGVAVGTPVVGSQGRFFYVSRTDNSGKGYLSVILAASDGMSAELTASMAPSNRNVPLGPPGLQRTLGQTNNNNPVSTEGDKVVVAENWGGGYTPDGSIYLLEPSAKFANNGGNASFQLLLVSRSSWNFSAVMAPLFVGTDLFIGGTSSNIAGWTGNRDLTNVLQKGQEDVNPAWMTQLDVNQRNASQPLLTTPVISSDGSFLYLAGASRNVYCLQSNNGRELWTSQTASEVISPPALFNDGNGGSVVYFVESMDGRVRQFNTTNGQENWHFNCQNITGIASCQDSVEADFGVAPSGNFIYYGDIFGQISALEVGNFATQSPTAAPSAQPMAAPSSAPSLSHLPTSSPTRANDTMATERPTLAKVATGPVGQGDTGKGHTAQSPTAQGPTGQGPAGQGVFGNNASAALRSAADKNGGNQSMSIGAILGAAIAGLLVLTLVAFFVARSLLKPKRKKKTTVTEQVSSGDVLNDLEASDGDDNDETEGDQMDDVTVTSGSGDSIEVEVMGGSNSYQTPQARAGKRKKRKNMVRTPPTTSTLASIQEIEDDDVPTGNDPKANLNDKFRSVEHTDNGTQRKAFERTGDSEGLHNLKSLADDVSVGSDDSVTLPPHPPPSLPKTPVVESSNANDAEEEKKDGESAGARTPGALSPQPSFELESEEPASPSITRSLFSSVAAAPSQAPSTFSNGARSPSPVHSSPSPPDRMSPSMMSTDSSLYTDDKTLLSTEKLSPLSTGVFGGSNDQGSLPDDEAAVLPSLTQGNKSESYHVNSRTPGAQYLNKKSSLRPKFKPSSSAKIRKVKSARTKRNLNGFTGSYLNNTEDSSDSSDEGRIRSKANPVESNKAPSFKRRNKRDEQPAPASSTIEGTWNSFLTDLAAAEQQFFSPTHAQKSAVLRYNNDDSFDDGTSASHEGDDEAVRAGSK